ncbi:MAG: hypothetical protein CVU99_16220 [Firmicutes bacterium HGW-Firmicutes-4]|jgi:hypothetical protein|nr:MAG: hypothetical protein CVU99_16220 [Firmicutes bacterium HGW-Firmicutes-4]
MLILIAIILGFLIGKIRRGSLHGFTVRKISLLPVGILGLVLQIALHLYIYTGGISLVEPYLEIVNFASYILILVMLVFNLDDFWVILMAVGITSNFVVIFVNGGHMPVAQGIIDILPAAFGEQITQGLNPLYSLIQPNTLLWFLGINLPIPVPYVPLVMSLYGSVAGVTVGTIVTLIGLIGFIQYVMNKKASIMHDERNDHGEDEGIFGDDEDNGFDGVSIQNSYQEGYDEPEDIDDYYRDMATTGGIRGDRDENATMVIPTEVFNSNESIGARDSFETRLIPAALDGVDSEIGTETEEIIISKNDGQETRVMEPVDDGSTKIISNIQEVGAYVKGDKELEAADMEEILNSDDAGFFTKKYYEEKLAVEKERLILQMREMELNKVAKSLSDPDGEPHPVPESDLRIVESFKLTDLDQPFVLRSETNSYDSGVKSKDEEDVEFSEDEMLNVWQRLNLEDEKRKAERRKQLMRETSKEAESLINGTPRDDVGIPLKEIEEVTEPVVGRVYESTSEDKEKMLANMDDNERKDFQETVDERKRAGYELVELKLDGKDVAFWRKKK